MKSFSRPWAWKMPTSWPPLAIMLDDLGNPPPKVLAKTFGVSEVTARKWIRNDRAPRSVQISLFWLTSWGRQHVHADAENGARLHAGLYEALKRENSALMARIAYLEKVGQFGARNAPIYEKPRLQVWG